MSSTREEHNEISYDQRTLIRTMLKTFDYWHYNAYDRGFLFDMVEATSYDDKEKERLTSLREKYISKLSYIKKREREIYINILNR